VGQQALNYHLGVNGFSLFWPPEKPFPEQKTVNSEKIGSHAVLSRQVGHMGFVLECGS